MKKTQKNNGKECSKKEYLDIEIYDHFKNPHFYILWNKKNILGEVVEDSIIQLLNKNQLVDFYFAGKKKFKIEKWKLDKYLLRNDK